jgi:alkylation response protein AidB-like acyl-CoA dehydrogenase
MAAASASPNASGYQAGPPLSAAEIVANARALSGYFKEQSQAIDDARRLPAEVVARARAAGLFRIAMPKIWGGPEFSTLEQVELIEELSRANSAVGWCVMIGCDSGIYSGYLDDGAARRLYPRLDMVTAGWVWPAGRAERVAGGYKVSGQWMFGSGITHADVVSAGCIVHENGVPVKDGGQTPRWRVMLAPASAFEIQDTWHTTGLRGTGSNHYRAAELFVPEENSFSFNEPARRPGTLWARNNAILPKGSGVPLGVARGTIDLFREMIQGKIEFPSGRPYRNLGRIQSAIAEAEMLIGAARSYTFASIDRHWQRMERGEEPTEQERADLWLSNINVCQSARQVIRLLFDSIGGGAIYTQNSAMDRALRDAETWCQHIIGQRRTLEMVGGFILKSDDFKGSPLL